MLDWSLMPAETLKDDYRGSGEGSIIWVTETVASRLIRAFWFYFTDIYPLFPMVVHKVASHSAYQFINCCMNADHYYFWFYFQINKTRQDYLATSNLELNLKNRCMKSTWTYKYTKLTGSSAALTRDLDNVAELFTASRLPLVGLS